MKQKFTYCIFVLLIATMSANAQFSENFSDGDFTANPAWGGSTTKWIVNAALQLQSNDNAGGSSYYLSTPSTLATTAQWDFYVNLKFATSGANYADVFLTASASDLSAATTTGYFVRVGNTADEISLYRKDGASSTIIINGTDGIVASSTDNKIRIRVIRNATNQWILSRDATGGTNYTIEGAATADATFTTSSFFGFYVLQSTAASARLNHYFDDITVQAYSPDITAPVIQSSTVLSATTLDVLFNEPLDAASAGTILNYSANNSIGNPVAAVLDGTNAALVHLTFAGSFPNATASLLTVNAVKDIAGNALSNGTTSFTYFAPYTPQKYDVVIDEIMADETPAVGLPEKEWIELKNTTTSAINLQGWRIKDGTGQSGLMPSYVLAPGAFVIVCASTSVADLSPFGATIAVTSFPSLNNTGEPVTLVNETGAVIHAVNYTLDWYHDAAKTDGGWTLEMINTKSPCSGISNWKASVDARGGTPGFINSADGGTADVTGPKLLSASVDDATHITLFFDETLDSLKAATIANYAITNGIAIASATTVAPLFDAVKFTLSSPLLSGTQYTITATGLTDCIGNAISGNNTAQLFIASPPARFDVVVNEIFFNPIPTINTQPPGVDYVEIYNRSNKVIDLTKLYLANRSSTTGRIGSLVKISAAARLLQPQAFVVATEDPSIVQRDFFAKDPAAFVTIPSMPSYSDDKGYVIICTVDTTIIDEIQYTEKWHFKLIDKREGVALERINYDDTSLIQSQQEKNWHSAATSVGYGTPTYKNSQYRINDGLQGEVKITPEIVSPDNDGQDDFATIDYNFPEPGYVANITIFDASGRPVRFLQRNALCGTKGFFRWDGLGEKNQQLAVGVYVVLTEVFNLSGKKKQFKTPIVLARRN